MTREQLSELMSAYLDGEVDSREKAMVESALRADPAARRLLEELRQTAAAVAALPRHGAPPNLAAEMDAQLERAQLLSGFRANENDPAARNTHWHAPLKTAAMLAVVLGAGWWVLSLQQDRRPERLAEAPPRETKEIGSESRATSSESLKPAPPAIETETLIASGADPVVLAKHSFELEPIRLRVVARDPAERDALSKQLTTQLAEANTANLAYRGVNSEKTQPVGAFYLEGKPGINYKNAREKQILVRLPQADAQRIVDDVLAGGKVHADQLALQVGPAIIRGSDKARSMLQIMAEKDQPAPSQPETPAVVGSQVRPTSTSFVNALGEIVGLGSLMKKKPAGDKGDRAAVGSRGATGEIGVRSNGTEASESSTAKSEGFADRVEREEKSESEGLKAETEHDSLVSKRLAVVVARRAEENAGGPPAAGGFRTQPTPGPLAPSPIVPAARQFITIVIEFAIPDPKPPVPSNPGRMRS